MISKSEQPFSGHKSPTRQVSLPCRGCTRKCGRYGQCKGKPWRAPG